MTAGSVATSLGVAHIKGGLARVRGVVRCTRLSLTDGSLSTYVRALKLGRLVKYECVPEFQSALYSPQPL